MTRARRREGGRPRRREHGAGHPRGRASKPTLTVLRLGVLYRSHRGTHGFQAPSSWLRMRLGVGGRGAGRPCMPERVRRALLLVVLLMLMLLILLLRLLLVMLWPLLLILWLHDLLLLLVLLVVVVRMVVLLVVVKMVLRVGWDGTVG